MRRASQVGLSAASTRHAEGTWMASEDDEVMREFLLESRENLNQLDRDFVTLEQDPQNRALLSSIFRCVHTIKGTAGFFGLSTLERLTHVGESLLSRLRDGELLLDTRSTSALLAMVDGVRHILGCLENNAGEGDQEFKSVIVELTELVKGNALPAPPPVSELQQVIATTRSVAPAKPTKPPPPPQLAPTPIPSAAPAPAAVAPKPQLAAAPPPPPAATAVEPAFAAVAEGAAEPKAGSSVADTSIRVDV